MSASTQPGSWKVEQLRATHERAEQGQDLVGRLLGEEVPAVLELVHLGDRERRLPVLELLPPERDVAQSPQDQRPLVRERRAVLPRSSARRAECDARDVGSSKAEGDRTRGGRGDDDARTTLRATRSIRAHDGTPVARARAAHDPAAGRTSRIRSLGAGGARRARARLDHLGGLRSRAGDPHLPRASPAAVPAAALVRRADRGAALPASAAHPPLRACAASVASRPRARLPGAGVAHDGSDHGPARCARRAAVRARRAHRFGGRDHLRRARLGRVDRRAGHGGVVGLHDRHHRRLRRHVSGHADWSWRGDVPDADRHRALRRAHGECRGVLRRDRAGSVP